MILKVGDVAGKETQPGVKAAERSLWEEETHLVVILTSGGEGRGRRGQFIFHGRLGAVEAVAAAEHEVGRRVLKDGVEIV